MVKINLRKYYPDFYTTDCIIEVPDEVAALMDSYEHAEAAYYLRRYRHKAYYSLDRGDGIEHDILFVSLSPCEIYERKVTVEQLHAAIAALPDKQAKRIYAYYFLGMSKNAIANAEGVSKAVVGDAIDRGLEKHGNISEKVSLSSLTFAPKMKRLMREYVFPPLNLEN